jgi:hypothetical protein
MPKAEVWVSLAALGVSAVSLYTSSVVARATERADEIRSERRTAYSSFLGAVDVCMTGAGELVEQGVQRSGDSDDEANGRAQDMEAQRASLRTDCFGPLRTSGSTVFLLADDEELRNGSDNLVIRTEDVARTALRYAASPGLWTPANDDVPADYLQSVDEQRATYDDFRTDARGDVQEPAPDLGDFIARWFGVIYVSCALLIAGFVWLFLSDVSPIKHRTEPQSRPDPHAEQTPRADIDAPA